MPKPVLYNLVSFKVADQEPGVSPTRLEENFSSYEGSPTSAPYRVADGNGWTNIVTAGNHAFWIRTRASGGATLTYVEATANGNGTSTSRDAENEMYFISPAVDLTKTTNNLFSFDIVTGYYVQDGLKILISDNAAATTTPSTVAWDDVTANFTIPVPTPANTYTVMASAGTMNLDTKYAGKKVYIAFKYNGGYAVGAGTLTTTYQIDNILVKGTAPQGGGDVKTRVENAVYTYSGSAWAPYPNAVILNPADYTAMGTSYLTATTAPNYLPAFLASKYPYAQEGNVKAMLYRTASSVTANAADEYTFTGGKWAPTALRTPKTEQYVFADKGWMFDPTVSLVLKRVTGNEPYLFNAITYIKDNMSDKWYPYTGRVNEEHYFGLNSYYAEIVFDGNRVTYGDQAIFDVKDDAAALDALLNERAIDGLKLLCQVNFPTMTPDVAGVEQIVYISIEHYYNANDRRFFKHKFKCVKAGTGMNDLPEFEHLGKEQLPSL